METPPLEHCQQKESFRKRKNTVNNKNLFTHKKKLYLVLIVIVMMLTLTRKYLSINIDYNVDCKDTLMSMLLLYLRRKMSTTMTRMIFVMMLVTCNDLCIALGFLPHHNTIYLLIEISTALMMMCQSCCCIC